MASFLGRLRSLGAEGAAAAAHDVEVAFPRLQARVEALSNLPPSAWRVLDVGCGYRYPNVILFTVSSVPVVGLDVLTAFHRDGLRALWHSERGLPVARRAWRFIKARRQATAYFRRMRRLLGHEVDHRALRLVRYDGGAFPFEGDSFNVVASNAVLEHVSDLAHFASQVRRVLSADGVFDMLWHNYYSYSGNHLPEDVNREHPWGHLTGRTEPPDTAGLNRALPSDIVDAFRTQLVVERCIPADATHRLQGEDGFQTEGAEWLTGALRDQLLAEYPEELLLSRAYVIQGSARPQ